MRVFRVGGTHLKQLAFRIEFAGEGGEGKRSGGYAQGRQVWQQQEWQTVYEMWLNARFAPGVSLLLLLLLCMFFMLLLLLLLLCWALGSGLWDGLGERLQRGSAALALPPEGSGVAQMQGMPPR